MPTPASTLTTGSMDARMIAGIRFVLASSALMIIYVDPSEPDRNVAFTYTALVLYTVHSATLYVLALYHRPLFPPKMVHWMDVGWYLVLISLSSGTSSIFFFFFFFPILVASFGWGFAEGLRVVIVCALLFTIVGFATAPAGPDFELNRFLLRPIYLIVLGYMIAHWGGSETTLRRRLALLKDISALSNPRFGVDRTIGSIMEQLRAFYDANACLLAMVDHATGGHDLRCVNRSDPEAAVHAEPLSEGLAPHLLALPAEQVVVYRGEPRFWEWKRTNAGVRAYDGTTGARMANPPQVGRTLLAEPFITVPFRHHGKAVGRLYLLAPRRCAFDTSEVNFLLLVMEHAMPTVENIRLVDRLASDAAETERQRIVHDLHDSVIQPYIGLQMGLAVVLQKLILGVDARENVERLIRGVDVEIANLRHYMVGLKDGGESGGGLLSAVRRFAGKFTEATGIAVLVEAGADIRVSDRLATELFQMVVEGLSNVRRHTSSTRVTIALVYGNGHFILRMENDVAAGAVPVSFTPRSIMERAAALGGHGRVEWENGNTAVIVEIPL